MRATRGAHDHIWMHFFLRPGELLLLCLDLILTSKLGAACMRRFADSSDTRTSLMQKPANPIEMVCSHLSNQLAYGMDTRTVRTRALVELRLESVLEITMIGRK